MPNLTPPPTPSQNGFTALEILIVLLILGLLIRVSYPSYRSFLDRAHYSEVTSKLAVAQRFVEIGVATQPSYTALSSSLSPSFLISSYYANAESGTLISTSAVFPFLTLLALAFARHSRVTLLLKTLIAARSPIPSPPFIILPTPSNLLQPNPTKRLHLASPNFLPTPIIHPIILFITILAVALTQKALDTLVPTRIMTGLPPQTFT